MKAYTDIEQSKKLIGFLPFESADKVHHGIHVGIDGKYHLSGDNTENDVIAIDKEAYNRIFGFEICNQLPCWSLTALLNILPHPRCFQGDKPIYWFCGCLDKDYIYHEVGASNPIDACVEMIIKLHELNLL